MNDETSLPADAPRSALRCRAAARLVSAAALIVTLAAATARAEVFFTKAGYEAANVTTNDVTFGGIVPGYGPPFIAVANPFVIGNVSIASEFNNNIVARSGLWGTPMDVYSPDNATAWATFTFSTPQTAVGFSISTTNTLTATSPVTAEAFSGSSMVASYTFEVSGPHVFDGFFGLDGVGPITEVKLTPDVIDVTGGDISDALLVEEVLSGHAVPEPAAWALMLVGLGGLGARLRAGQRRRGFGAGFARTMGHGG